MSDLSIAVVGASGRMGRAVVRLATEEGIAVRAAIAASDVGRDAGELAGVGPIGVTVTGHVGSLVACDAQVIVDFSSPDLLPDIAEVAVRAGTALVSGTTGVDADGALALDEAARSVAVLWEPNMSVGVHVLGDLLRRAVALLGAGFDIEIVETHHRAKVDAPSGTAKRLAEIARQARGVGTLVTGREGKPGARKAQEIGVLAVRGGDVVGDHVVHLLGAGERLELVHRATSRDLFARGALRAARALAERPAGRYTLADVIG